MSYFWSGMAVRSDKNKVLDEIRGFFGRRGSTVNTTKDVPKRGDLGYFRITSHGDWTLVGFSSMCIVPALSVALSRQLQTKLITAGEYEVIGLQHFSVVESGVTQQTFTIMEGEIDALNVDGPAMMAQDLADPGEGRYAAGTKVEEFPDYVYGIYLKRHCELKMEDLFIDGILADDTLPYFFIDDPKLEEITVGYADVTLKWPQLVTLGDPADQEPPPPDTSWWKFWN